jgi:CheY-like chemotaxis protein
MRNILFYKGKFDDKFFVDSFFSRGELTENYDDDLDQQIHTYLLNNDTEETNSFILPISINGNFFDFSGLIFAHHVRLTRSIKCCDVTIVFYGTLEIEQLLRLTPLARILLTVNVLYVNVVKYSFDDIQKSIERYKPKQFDINQLLKQIHINPPSNYDDNHHSIDNEFALIQWARYIKCFNSLPQQFKKEFDSQLYFKYLRAKYALSEIYDHDQFKISTLADTKILLIDDEAQKGWENFYESFFRNSKIIFKDSGIEFKNEEKNNLIVKIESRVKYFEPDVVLLDLRLNDSDFAEDVEPKNLTGIKILEKIKEINSGIQIIITTASNKAWNFNLAKQKGTYDFIIKDGFENPEKAIDKLAKAIEIAAKRAFFLKRIGEKNSEIKDFILQNSYFDDKSDENKEKQEKTDSVRNKLYSNLDLAFELLDLSSEIPGKKKYFAYSYLQYFICIEEFLNIREIFNHGDKCYVGKTTLVAQIDPVNRQWTSSIKYMDTKNPSYYNLKEDSDNRRLNPLQTDFRMSSVLIYLFNQESSNSKNWPVIRDIRNQKAAHPEKGNVTQENIIQLLDFLLFIFNKGNLKLEVKKKGLPDEWKQEDIEKLKERFS